MGERFNSYLNKEKLVLGDVITARLAKDVRTFETKILIALGFS